MNRRSKSRAFYIETLIITFLLLSMLTILVRVYGKAGEMSLRAGRVTRASLIAQNIVSLFEAEYGTIGDEQNELLQEALDSDDEEYPTAMIELRFSEDGALSDEGEYLAQLQMSAEERMTGYMISASAFIFHQDDPEDLLSSIDTAKYFPDEDDDDFFIISEEPDI